MKKWYKECPFCKNEIKIDAIKCMYCKEMLPIEEPVIEHPETKICPFCKNEIKYEAIKCQFCHEMLDDKTKWNVIDFIKSKFEKWQKETEKTNIEVNEENDIENISNDETNETNENNIDILGIENHEIGKSEVVEWEIRDIKATEKNQEVVTEEVKESVKWEYSWNPKKFGTRIWIYVYFIIIMIFVIIWFFEWYYNIWYILFWIVAVFELFFIIVRNGIYIKAEKDWFEIREYISSPIKLDTVKLKYEEIESIKFKTHKRSYFVLYLALWLYYNSPFYGKIHDHAVDSEGAIFAIFFYIFLLQTIPLLIASIGCSNVEIKTKDWTINLPRIVGIKDLMIILEEVWIKYTF